MHKELSIQLFNNQLEHMLQTPELVDKGITLVYHDNNYAVISIPLKNNDKKVYLRIENINFDIEPVNIYFVNPENYKRLPENLYPSGNGIAGGHDFLQNPVICISGTYSYHTHPSHRDKPYDIYRNSFQLSNLIKRIKMHLDSDWSVPKGGHFNEL